MKFGFRRPSLNKRIAARTSLKRVLAHNLGLKAPRGWGWLTDPEKAAYNRVYSRTTKGCSVLLLAVASAMICIMTVLFQGCGADCGNCSPNGGCVRGQCHCDRGFEGVDCGWLIRDRYTGAHSVADTCTSGIKNYMVGVMGDTLLPYGILIGNFGSHVVGARAELEGSTITILQQSIQAQSASIDVVGTGSLTATGMHLTYILSDGTTADTCHCTTLRQ